MTDVLTAEQRTRNMKGIRSADTAPERTVRSGLFRLGFRFRKNDPRLPGRPDVVLPRYRTVIFVNGCFWHRHPGCRYAALPETRRDYWLTKLSRNVERDAKVREALVSMGWRVIIVWECELRRKSDAEARILSLAEEIRRPAETFSAGTKLGPKTP